MDLWLISHGIKGEAQGGPQIPNHSSAGREQTAIWASNLLKKRLLSSSREVELLRHAGRTNVPSASGGLGALCRQVTTQVCVQYKWELERLGMPVLISSIIAVRPVVG